MASLEEGALSISPAAREKFLIVLGSPLKFVSGLADCHVPGLYSLVLSERTSNWAGMRRVFFASEKCCLDLWEGADFRVKPHNHRQSIGLTLLFGRATNVGLKFNRFGEIHVWKYRFGSALLNGGFDLQRMEDDWCALQETPLSRKPLLLHWSTVHTVVADPGTAWLVEELDLAPVGTERCFSVSHRLTLSSDGLYRPMSEEEIEEAADQVRRAEQVFAAA